MLGISDGICERFPNNQTPDIAKCRGQGRGLYGAGDDGGTKRRKKRTSEVVGMGGRRQTPDRAESRTGEHQARIQMKKKPQEQETTKKKKKTRLTIGKGGV